MLDVTFTAVNEFTTKGLVDSGAVNTIFDSSLATAAGVDLTDAEDRTTLVGGGRVDLKIVKLTLSVPFVPDPHNYGAWFTFESEVGFAVNWGERFGLLGNDFFRFFTMTFRTADLEFEVEPNSH